MGYCVEIYKQKIRIPMEKQEAAFQELRTRIHFVLKGMIGTRIDKALNSCKDFTELMEELFEHLTFRGGDLVGVKLFEKWWYEEDIFELLAPFMDDGSTIMFIGEDFATWQYRFNAGVMTKLEGTLVFEEKDEPLMKVSEHEQKLNSCISAYEKQIETLGKIHELLKSNLREEYAALFDKQAKTQQELQEVKTTIKTFLTNL